MKLKHFFFLAISIFFYYKNIENGTQNQVLFYSNICDLRTGVEISPHLNT